MQSDERQQLGNSVHREGNPNARSRASAIRSLLPRPTVAAGLLLAAGGIVLCFRPLPGWWFGGALLLACLVVLRQACADRLARLGERLRQPLRPGPFGGSAASLLLEGGYLALIVSLATLMLGRVALGDRPVMHDHAVHFVKAWQMHEHFLPQGRLMGWSQLWFAGYPAGYLYPIGTDLWINAVHALFLGLLSFGQAYAVAFWLSHVLTGYASYRFGRVVGGPHVGVLAAVLALTDISEFRFGGWAYTIVYGVWPQSLSLAFALLAFSRLPALVGQRRLRDIAAFGFWMGLALITHPVHLLLLPIIFAVCALAAAFAREIRAPAAMLRLLLGSLLALLIGSVWLLPFLANRAFIFPMGVWWDTTYEMAKGLLDLDALPGTLGFVLAFGVLGAAVALSTRRFALLFTALMALLVPLLCSATFIDELHLPELFRAFTRVQFIRVSTMVKPFWFTLAGYLVVVVVRLARSLSRSEAAALPATEAPPSDLWGRYLQPACKALVVGFAITAFLVPLLQAFWARHLTRQLVLEPDRPLGEEREQVVAWAKRNLPAGGFYRIGLFTGHEHELMDLALDLGRPIYKRGFTPCENYLYKMRTREPEILEALNVRYAVTKKNLPEEQFDLLQRFGRLKIYRFKGYRPDPFRVIDGQGEVTLRRFDDEEIVLEAAPGSRGTLRLNVSYFSRWSAYRDGQTLPIGTVSLEAEPETTGFMTVPLAPGRYRFVFERTLLDEMGLPLSLLGLLLACALALADRRQGLEALRRPLEALTARVERWSHPGPLSAALIGFGTLALLGAGIGLSEWTPPLRLEGAGTPRVRRVVFDFLEGIRRARAGVEYPEINRSCPRFGDMFVCPDENGDPDINSYVSAYPVTIKEYTMRRCIRARPIDDAVLGVIYPRVRVGDALVGYFGVEHEGRLLLKRRPVSFSIVIDGTRAYAEDTHKDTVMHWFNLPIRQRTRSRRVDVAFTVSANNVSKRYFCFYAQMVNF